MDGGGAVSLGELQRVFQKHAKDLAAAYGAWGPEMLTPELFERFDTDVNGDLERDEFIKFMQLLLRRPR